MEGSEVLTGMGLVRGVILEREGHDARAEVKGEQIRIKSFAGWWIMEAGFLK